MNASLNLSAWGRHLGKQLSQGNQKKKAVQNTHRWKIVTGDKVQVGNVPHHIVSLIIIVEFDTLDLSPTKMFDATSI